jgi:hypothetical protein
MMVEYKRERRTLKQLDICYLFQSNAVKCVDLLADPWSYAYKLMIILYSTKAIVVGCACGQHRLVKSLSEVILKSSTLQGYGESPYFLVGNIVASPIKGGRGLSGYVEGSHQASWRNFSFETRAVESCSVSSRNKEATQGQDGFCILSMATISDKILKNVMQLLSMSFLNACQRYHTDWMVLIMRRLVCNTIQLELSKYAPLAFAGYAKPLAKEGHFEGLPVWARRKMYHQSAVCEAKLARNHLLSGCLRGVLEESYVPVIAHAGSCI